MNYKVIDKETYYRKGVFRHFTEDCACSTSMTARIDVTDLVHHSKETGTKFYINFLYILSKVLNSREDYRMGYLKETNELICYDVINPIQYIFHEDTETFTLVYTEYDEDYEKFYKTALRDAEEAKKTREYGFDIMNHPNWFDASCICLPSYLYIAATSCFKRSAVFGSPRSRARVSMSEESAFSDSILTI